MSQDGKNVIICKANKDLKTKQICLNQRKIGFIEWKKSGK